MEATRWIPRRNFNKWYECFKACGGRLLCNPVDGNRVYVRYTFDNADNYNRFQQDYQRLTTPINESVKKYSYFHKVKVLLKHVFQ
jgi:hypothetical protein